MANPRTLRAHGSVVADFCTQTIRIGAYTPPPPNTLLPGGHLSAQDKTRLTCATVRVRRRLLVGVGQRRDEIIGGSGSETESQGLTRTGQGGQIRGMRAVGGPPFRSTHRTIRRKGQGPRTVSHSLHNRGHHHHPLRLLFRPLHQICRSRQQAIGSQLRRHCRWTKK